MLQSLPISITFIIQLKDQHKTEAAKRYNGVKDKASQLLFVLVKFRVLVVNGVVRDRNQNLRQDEADEAEGENEGDSRGGSARPMASFDFLVCLQEFPR